MLKKVILHAFKALDDCSIVMNAETAAGKVCFI